MSYELTAKSQAFLDTLLPDAKFVLSQFVTLCHSNNYNLQITSGSRTLAEQDALYAIGRSKPGKIITNARGGYSNHNFGIAIDVVVLHEDVCDWRWETYAELFKLAERHDFVVKGLWWGGEWESFPEAVHFDMSNGDPIHEIQKRYPIYYG